MKKCEVCGRDSESLRQLTVGLVRLCDDCYKLYSGGPPTRPVESDQSFDGTKFEA